MFGNKATFPDKGESIDHSQLRRLERMSRKAMLSQAGKMDPIAFEHMVGALFERMGYEVRTTVASGDQGVDLYVRQGRRTAVVQCKRYKGDVGSPQVRDLYGTMLHNSADEAYMVTTGSISNQARQWADGKPIRLIDGFALVEWISTLDQQRSTRRRTWLLAAAAVVVLAVAFVATRGGLPAALETVSSVRLPGAETTEPASPGEDTTPSPSPTQDPGSALDPTSMPTPEGADADPTLFPTTEPDSGDPAPVTPAPTPVPTPAPTPVLETPAVLTFTDKERGYAFTYDSRWTAEKMETAGRGQGLTVRLAQQGYTFQIQAQELPFAVPFCPTPTAEELESSFRQVLVNGVVMWRPRIESGTVVRAADGAILPIPVIAAITPIDVRRADADFLCAFPTPGGFLAISYLLPTNFGESGQIDTDILSQMDTMLQSLVWEDGTR